MKKLLVFMVGVGSAMSAHAQPALMEPPEYPSRSPGPPAVHSGDGCFHVATGTIVPGDVDWLQVSIPWASLQTIVDVDFPTGPTGTGSVLLASVVGGSSSLNSTDSNNARDGRCGLGALTTPLGSTRDSAVDLLATPRNAVINIGVSGVGDSGFTGNHSQTFTYDVWVFVDAAPCGSDADCTDGVACTVDACDVATGHCSNSPNDGACDNGRFCDGQETCHPTLGCRLGTWPLCDDGVDCTQDDCDDDLNACVHVSDDGYCDNESFCDGPERCDPVDGCQSSSPPSCDDEVDCTVDSCDDEVGCVHTADDDLCDDHRFCNGEESCDATEGCQEGAAPCGPGESCVESSQDCMAAFVGMDIKPGDCPNRINTKSWGHFLVALVGSEGFDVRQVNIATLTLSRTDGVGGAVAPFFKQYRSYPVFEDTASLYVGETCGCHEETGDGMDDLNLRFLVEEAVHVLELNGLSGRTIELELSGEMRDGRPFAATDCLKFSQVYLRK